MKDLSKWALQSKTLVKHSKVLLESLDTLRYVLDLEKKTFTPTPPNDPAISFREFSLIPEAAEFYQIPRLALFMDPGIAGIKKHIKKKFPNTGDLGKVLDVLKGFTNISVPE
jgi:hypothetical protein